MVLGHASAPGRNVIYLFHMAIFFISSGFFYSAKHSESFSKTYQYTVRKLRSLYIPYVLWTLLFTLLHNTLIRLNIFTDNPQILQFLNGNQYDWVKSIRTPNETLIWCIKALFLGGGSDILGAFWFIRVLLIVVVCYNCANFIIRIIFPRINSLGLNISQTIISGILLLCGFYCQRNNIYLFNLEIVMSVYCLYHLGYLFKQLYHTNIVTRLQQFLIPHISGTIISICVAVILSFILWMCSEYGSVSLAANRYEDPIFLIIVSTLGWFFVYSLAIVLSRIPYISNIFITIGQHTMSIMTLHLLFFKFVNKIVIAYYDMPDFCSAAFPIVQSTPYWWILYSASGIIFPLLLSILYSTINAKIQKK